MWYKNIVGKHLYSLKLSSQRLIKTPMNAFIQFVKANKISIAVGTALVGTAAAIYYGKDSAEDVVEAAVAATPETVAAE